MSLAKELLDRGLINQFSANKLEDIVDVENRIIYHGIDPTANSAHVGNMVVWMLLRHLAKKGHKIIFLIGGGTGMIGDPKPDNERILQTEEDIAENVAKIKTQAEKFFSGAEIEFVDNADWLKNLNLIEFLRDVGKHYTVNDLIKKEAVANRLASDAGLSYTEFAYPLLQGFDYLQLYRNYNCTAQVGGSDQWGNIISGIDLVRRKEQKEVYGLTTPLIIDKATGKKFGKSEGNAIWLDPQKTSPYKFYQFWLNSSDESVFDHLKVFTEIPLSEIEELQQNTATNPGDREAQKRLAFSVTSMVHGEKAAESAAKVSDILFNGVITDDLSADEKSTLLETAPNSSLVGERELLDVLVETSLAGSKREARTFITNGAVSVNNQKITDANHAVKETDAVSDLILIKRGKKQMHILHTN